MQPMRFDYHRASDVDDALNLIARLGEGAKFLAGGQSLLPSMNLRLSGPSDLIDLSRVAELTAIRREVDGLVIGAAVRYADMLASPDLGTVPLLALALPHVANAAVRNRGTLGGSLCHADPSAETAGVLLALDATVELRSRQGTRRMPVAEFVTGVYETALEPGELLTAIRIPLPGPTWCWFDEHVRRRGDFAMAGLAACATRAPDGTIRDLRLAVTGLGARARLAGGAMAMIEGRPLTEALRRAAVAGLCDDLCAGAADLAEDPYRLALAEDLLDRALASLADAEGRT